MPINRNIKPTNNEVLITPSKVIMSKTDKNGIIQYGNDYFIEISGYSQNELVGQAHNIIRHPDMPKIVFKIMWEKLHKGENLYAIVKNMTKNGDYYWVVTKFETSYDKNGVIIAHYARRKHVPIEVRETTESIYKIISRIEKYDIELAEKTLYETLDKYGLTYDSLFLELAGMTEREIDSYFESKEENVNIATENAALKIDDSKNENDVATKVASTLLNRNMKGEDTIIIEPTITVKPTSIQPTIIESTLINSAITVNPKLIVKVKEKKEMTGFFGDSQELKDALSSLIQKSKE